MSQGWEADRQAMRLTESIHPGETAFVDAIAVWEDDGGARLWPAGRSNPRQRLAAWAQRKVNHEFDRVARTLRSAASQQSCAERCAEIEQALALFESKRDDVLSLRQIRFYIQNRDTIDEKTYRMIASDVCYLAVKSLRIVRRATR